MNERLIDKKETDPAGPRITEKSHLTEIHPLFDVLQITETQGEAAAVFIRGKRARVEKHRV